MMKLSNMLSALTLTGSLLCATALAQTHVCLGGDLEHLTKAQKESCSSKVQAVRRMAASLHAPEDWHFVVVCGEEGWKQYTDYTMRQDASLAQSFADTDFLQHETFLRESGLDGLTTPGTPNVLSREIAGILSRTPQTASSGL